MFFHQSKWTSRSGSSLSEVERGSVSARILAGSEASDTLSGDKILVIAGINVYLVLNSNLVNLQPVNYQ